MTLLLPIGSCFIDHLYAPVQSQIQDGPLYLSVWSECLQCVDYSVVLRNRRSDNVLHCSKRIIRHPDIRVKHCAYGHSVATLLNPRGVTTVYHKYGLTVTRRATVLVAVPSTVHYPANYKMKIFYLT
jgi:hypothetical protein